MSRYLVNEMFHSIQGEGVRAGIPHVFVRFAKCNLACNVAEHGFDCDTDFEHGQWYTLDDLVAALPACPWVLLTGGEPALQADQPLIDALHGSGREVAIETNGTMPIPRHLDWVCISPKPSTTLALDHADEEKHVLAAGQEPIERLATSNPLVSPAFKGDELDPDALAWCIQWVLDHPQWRLSCQQHKWWGVR